MKIILKIFKYMALTMVIILLLLAGLTLVVQGRITQIFNSEINRYTETGITVEKVGFSLIRGFPRARVEFKNLRLEAHPSPDPWIDSLMAGQSFLDAGFVYASFNVRDILHKEYCIDRLTLKNSSIILFKDDNGSTLKRILKEEFRNDSSHISFDLDNIRLENTGFRYLSNKNHLFMDFLLDNASGKLSHNEKGTSIEVKTGFDINNISSGDRKITRPVEKGELGGELLITADSVHFRQLELLLDNQSIGLKGAVFQKKRSLALDITTSNTDAGRLMDYLATDTGFKHKLTINNLDAQLRLAFDSLADSFSARVSSYNIEYAGATYYGSASLNKLDNSLIDLRLNGPVDLEKFLSLHPADRIENAEGKVHLNAMLRGRIGKLRDISTDDLLKLKRRINLNLSGVSLKLKDYAYPLENISGNIMLGDNAWADELSLTVAGQNLVMNGKIENPAGLLADNGEQINVSAGIWADKLVKDLFLSETDKRQTTNDERGEDKSAEPKTLNAQHFLKRINASLSITLDSLIVDNFRASQFNGLVNYRPGMINISSFNLLAFGGSLAGNAAMVMTPGVDYQARTWLDIQTADIHQVFKVFNNFKQNQIIAENIKGDLSGSLSISTRLDSSFSLLPSDLYVTGSYSIFDGELMAFEPIMKLSRFIEVSELENIVFEDLHNDLLISDSRILIPSMEINSSAFNISLSGEQDFSGDFEYHLRVLLSDILSKKARKADSYISEFGEVEDDGLGRTSLFLKLQKHEGETRVSYDVKKLSEEIKESLKEEKQSLKTILNEEYGWYNADSLKNTPETGKRVFRITWEEADSVKTVVPGEGGKKPGRTGIFNKIFKADTSKKKF